MKDSRMEKNTKAKVMLKNVDFSGVNAHLAYTLDEGAASLKNEAYLFKGQEKLDPEARNRAVELAKGVTFNNKRVLIENALRLVYPDMWCWALDYNETLVWFELDEQLYQVSYELNGVVIELTSEAVKVVPQTVYVLEQNPALESQPEEEESVKLTADSEIRDVEKALRQCGLSRRVAKALVANGYQEAFTAQPVAKAKTVDTPLNQELAKSILDLCTSLK